MADQYKRSTREIQSKADDAIRDMIRECLSQSYNVDLLDNATQTNKEIGIDFFMEGVSRDKSKVREIFFCAQNKGRHGKFDVRKRDGQISFQLKVWHAKYYLSMNQPLVILFCNTKAKQEIYWYAIQLDTEIQKQVTEQEKIGIKTVQLSVPTLNILNENTFERFLSDIRASEKAQLYKFQKKNAIASADYELTKRHDEDKNVVDHICRVLDLFEGVHVLPEHIISKLYPFRGNKTAFINTDRLETDSEDFFNLLLNIELNGKEYSLKNTLVDYYGIPDFQAKIKAILNFLGFNYIRHVHWVGEGTKERICVHDLFYSDNCDCERCTYRRLNLPEVLVKLDEVLDLENSAELRLRKAYTHFLMSDYYTSFLIHKQILEGLNITKQPSLYTITKFNLIQLKRIANAKHMGEGRFEIINYEPELFADEMVIPHHFIEVYRSISRNEFIHDALWSIDSSLSKIQKIWLSDKRGGTANNSYVESLLVDFGRAYNFIEYNLIIYNEYHQFDVLVNKALEGLLCLHSIINRESSSYKHFSVDIVQKWLLHSNSEHIRYLVGKYGVKRIKVNDSSSMVNYLNETIDNLIISSDIILKHFNDKGFSHDEKIRQILSNFVVILALVDIEQRRADQILKKYLKLISRLNEWYFTGFENLQFYLFKRKPGKTNLRQIIKLLEKYECFEHDLFDVAMEFYLDGKTTTDDEIKKIFKLKDFTIEQFTKRNVFGNLAWLICRLSDEVREKLRHEATKILYKKFDRELYYKLCAHNILNFDEKLFKKFVRETPNLKEKWTDVSIMGQTVIKNFYLDMVIDQIFKYKIPINSQIKKLTKKAIESEYYDWLLDLDGYDYNKFKPYWIMYQTNINYLSAYRQSDVLKKAITKSLSEDYIEGVARTFLRIYEPQK